MRNRGIRFRWRWAGETTVRTTADWRQDMFLLLTLLVVPCHSLPHISSRPRADRPRGHPDRPSMQEGEAHARLFYSLLCRMDKRVLAQASKTGSPFRHSLNPHHPCMCEHKTENAATGKYALHATKAVEALWNTSKTPRPFDLSGLIVNTRDVS